MVRDKSDRERMTVIRYEGVVSVLDHVSLLTGFIENGEMVNNLILIFRYCELHITILYSALFSPINSKFWSSDVIRIFGTTFNEIKIKYTCPNF